MVQKLIGYGLRLIDWFPGNKVSCGIWCQDRWRFDLQGMFGCWRVHNGNSSFHNILKCCLPWKCFSDCCTEWSGCFCCRCWDTYLNAPCWEKIWTWAGKEAMKAVLWLLSRHCMDWRQMGLPGGQHLPRSFWRWAIDQQGQILMSRFGRLLSLMGTSTRKCFWFSWRTYWQSITNLNSQCHKIQELYHLKDNFIGPLKHYLGANTIACFQLQSAFAHNYIKTAVQNIKEVLSQDPIPCILQNLVDHPLPLSYQPEVDVSTLLDLTLMTQISDWTGSPAMDCWIGLGAIYLPTFQSLLHTMHYQGKGILRHYIMYSPISSPMKIQELSLIQHTQFLMWDNSTWQIGQIFTQMSITRYPRNARAMGFTCGTPWGVPVGVSCFVDADHAGNLVTQCSQMGILIFVNRAPITWYLKCQNMVESSTFGSKFTAMHISTDLIFSLL